MRFLELEASKFAYRADFALYGTAVVILALVLAEGAPAAQWAVLAPLVLLGYLLWTLLEYALHRFVLHGLQPFQAMHEQHHRRPPARIGTPTVVSAPLFLVFVCLPAWAWGGWWPACALTLGLLAGYLAYAAVHHLCHHGLGKGRWMVGRQRWHARHHQRGEVPGCYGVSHPIWDHVFGTVAQPFGRRR